VNISVLTDFTSKQQFPENDMTEKKYSYQITRWFRGIIDKQELKHPLTMFSHSYLHVCIND